jgi:cytochrome c oxidase subunit I+III
MYVIGLLGMRRASSPTPKNWGSARSISSPPWGLFLGPGLRSFASVLLWSGLRGRSAGDNPWGGGTLEWSITSPPHTSGFPRPPIVRDRYPIWYPPPAGCAAARPGAGGRGSGLPADRVGAPLAHGCHQWTAAGRAISAGADAAAVCQRAVAILAAAISILAQSYIAAIIAAVLAGGLIGWWLYNDPSLPSEEADELVASVKLPLFSSGTRAVGWWGMLGMIAILFTVLGALIYGYFYLRLYAEQWPQMGLPLPAWGAPFILYSILIAGGIVQVFNIRARRHDRRGPLIRGLSAVMIAGLIFFAGKLLNLLGLPYSPTTSAYGSIFYTLNGFVLLLVLTGVLFIGATLTRVVRSKEPLSTPRLTLWLQNSELFWFFTAAAGVLTFLTTYVSPYVLTFGGA